MDIKRILAENRIEPDIEGLLTVIRRQAMPDRVHHIELFLDEEIKDHVCNRFDLDKDIRESEPFANLKRDIRLHKFLGYDAFRIGLLKDAFATKTLSIDDTTTIAGQRRETRSWTDEHIGPIQSWSDIDEVKIDAKHSYEDNIMPVTEAKRRYGQQIAILGGIDVDFLCRADEQAIRKRVRETLNVCMPGGGYCLGTGNTVANYIPLDNYLTMLDEGRRF